MKNSYSKIPHYLSIEDFYAEVIERMKHITSSDMPMALLTLDFDNFNYLNDFFSYEIGNLTLRKISEHFSAQLKEDEVFTKIHSDHFTFCLTETEYSQVGQKFLRLTDLKEALIEVLPPHYSMVASGGVIVVRDSAWDLSALLDKANYARKRTKGNTFSSFRFYDEKMAEDIQWQKIVTYSMEPALSNHEFEMYLQPKVHIRSDEIVGAEALVRWNSPEYGLVFPDRFIPIMEQNGFIRQLDFFMLEEACLFLKESKSLGRPQLPISVNFSKAHLSTERLVERIFQTVNRIGITTNLIEIEFTESLSMEDFEKLAEIVTDLKLLGFRVSLDDFGNAYSSLSCLKDLPFDIIKIDKGFLNSSSNTEKGRLIIRKVLELVKSLQMLSVMEGVEDQEQVDFLRKLNCDFGQGYFYAKPMPKDAYEKYLDNGSVIPDIQNYSSGQMQDNDKSHLYVIPQEIQMDNWELYTLGKNIDMGLMKGYLDGEATVQYVNDRALEYLGYTRQEFRETFHNSIAAFTHPEDIPIVQKNAKQLLTSGKPLQFKTRAIRKDGKVIVLQGRSSCVIDNMGRPIGLYAFQDVTEELERTEKMRISLENRIKELEERVMFCDERKT